MTLAQDLAPTPLAIVGEGSAVDVRRPGRPPVTIAAAWLFDHALEARDTVSGQRLHGVAELGSLVLERASLCGDGVVATFRDGRQAKAPLAALDGFDPRAAPPETRLWETPERLAAVTPVALADYLGDDAALAETLRRVARDGLALLHGAPAEPGVVEPIVARFGFVRETNYGRLFDVRIAPRPGNLAYTDLALDLHTDNPYRDPTPSLQLLHAIVVDAGGGESLFVDGLAQAEGLRRDEPDAFETLARTPVRFTYRQHDGAVWTACAPVLQCDVEGAVRQVRLNHRSLDLEPREAAEQGAWYRAYLAFWRRAHAPAAALEQRLAPGDVVLFDNRRILHARRAITSSSPRWLQGCYADIDGLLATLARLEGGRP